VGALLAVPDLGIVAVLQGSELDVEALRADNDLGLPSRRRAGERRCTGTFPNLDPERVGTTAGSLKVPATSGWVRTDHLKMLRWPYHMARCIALDPQYPFLQLPASVSVHATLH
jgi:hypothetical protein